MLSKNLKTVKCGRTLTTHLSISRCVSQNPFFSLLP